MARGKGWSRQVGYKFEIKPPLCRTAEFLRSVRPCLADLALPTPLSEQLHVFVLQAPHLPFLPRVSRRFRRSFASVRKQQQYWFTLALSTLHIYIMHIEVLGGW